MTFWTGLGLGVGVIVGSFVTWLVAYVMFHVANWYLERGEESQMARVINGRMALTFVSAETQKVVKSLHAKIVKEPEARSREINTALGEALIALSKGTTFGDEFNAGADKTVGTLEAHFNTVGVYDDGEMAFRTDVEWYDLDTVEMEQLCKLFESLK